MIIANASFYNVPYIFQNPGKGFIVSFMVFVLIGYWTMVIRGVLLTCFITLQHIHTEKNVKGCCKLKKIPGESSGKINAQECFL